MTMKLYTTKAYRARLAECFRIAEMENVYIKNRGGRLFQLTAVPNADARAILNLLGEMEERNLKK